MCFDKHKLISFEYNNKKYLVFVEKDRDLENHFILYVRDAYGYKTHYGESYFTDHDYYLCPEF